MNPLLLLGGLAAVAVFLARRGTASAAPRTAPGAPDTVAAVRAILSGRPDEMKKLAASFNRSTTSGNYVAGLLEMTADAVLQNRLPAEVFEGNRAWTWALGVINSTLSSSKPDQAPVLNDLISAMAANGLLQSQAATLTSQLTRG